MGQKLRVGATAFAVAVSLALIATAGVLGQGSVTADVDARYRTESDAVAVKLFEPTGLVLLFR